MKSGESGSCSRLPGRISSEGPMALSIGSSPRLNKRLGRLNNMYAASVLLISSPGPRCRTCRNARRWQRTTRGRTRPTGPQNKVGFRVG
eukprot:1828566-Alexandrium_andersonii.AAC.1